MKQIRKDELKILTSLDNMLSENTFNNYIEDVKQYNPVLWDFISVNNKLDQVLLLDGGYGTGKTHTLKALALLNIQTSKQLLKDCCTLSEDQITRVDNSKTMSELYSIISEVNNDNFNTKAFLSAFNNMIFIDIDNVLYSENWRKELFNQLLLVMINHDPNFVAKVNDNPTLPNIDSEHLTQDIFCIDNMQDAKQAILESTKKALKDTNITFNLGWISISKDITMKEYTYTNNTIIELINIFEEENLTMVFENLDRANSDKIIDFLSQFSQIFHQQYDNSRKFIFTLDKSELLESIGRKDRNSGFLSKYFEVETSLNNYDKIKYEMFEKIELNNESLGTHFGNSFNVFNIKNYLHNFTNSLSPLEKLFINKFFGLPIREIERYSEKNIIKPKIMKEIFHSYEYDVNLLKTSYKNFDVIQKIWTIYHMNYYFVMQMSDNKLTINELYNVTDFDDKTKILTIVKEYMSLSDSIKYFGEGEQINLTSKSLEFIEELIKNITTK